MRCVQVNNSFDVRRNEDNINATGSQLINEQKDVDDVTVNLLK